MSESDAQQWISAYTSDLVDPDSRIRIEPTDSLKKLIGPQTSLEDAFSFSPRVKGKASLTEDGRYIDFHPYKGQLKEGKEYECRIDLAALSGDESLKDFSFRFHVAKREVKMQGVQIRIDPQNIGMAIVTFKNGAVATIEGTTNVYPQNLEETLYLFGENGTVKLGGKSTNNIDVWDFADETDEDQKNKGLEEQTSNVYGNGHTSIYADIIDAINSDRKPYVDAVAGRNALEMILAIYKSAADGTPVKLPIANVASTDFCGRFDNEK